MTNTEECNLINKVIDLINTLYEVEYVGDIKIEQTEDGYILSLFLNKDFLTPQCRMYVQCKTEDEFLDFVREELAKKALHHTKYFTGEQIKFDEYKKRRYEKREN